MWPARHPQGLELPARPTCEGFHCLRLYCMIIGRQQSNAGGGEPTPLEKKLFEEIHTYPPEQFLGGRPTIAVSTQNSNIVRPMVGMEVPHLRELAQCHRDIT